MDASRPIAPALFFRVANTSLARVACDYADPGAHEYPHDHAACLVDDESLAADRLLRLAGALAINDDDAILAAVEHITTNLLTRKSP